MGEPAGAGQVADVTEARRLFPATGSLTYFNTAAVGLTSSAAAEAYHSCVDDWTRYGPDWARGEAAAESARAAVASLMGARAADMALIALATPDHKFLMNAGRGMGYCYLSPNAQDRFVPTNAGWKAGAVPVQSFFGPTMELSPTASRFESCPGCSGPPCPR